MCARTGSHRDRFRSGKDHKAADFVAAWQRLDALRAAYAQATAGFGRVLIPNFLDPDDDGDGKRTRDEIVIGADGSLSFPDSNGNGIPDYLDPTTK